MVLSDAETAGRLQLMVADIEQDAAEKVEELEVLTEEELKIARKKALQRHKEYVDKQIKKSMEKVTMETKRVIAKTKNELHCLEQMKRHEKIRDIIHLAKQRLDNINHAAHSPSYIKILYLLIVQGLLKLVEPIVVVKARESDISLVEKVLNEAENFYHVQTGTRTKLVLCKDEFLDLDTNGGIILCTKNRQISLNNTLAARVDIISDLIMPDIRALLFRRNPHSHELK